MGWSIGWDTNWYRDIGYGVPALCDHPDCTAQIDRGLAFVCGGEPYGGDKGCGLYFCADHLWFGGATDDPQMCRRCCDGEPPFEPKPDVEEWVRWKLTDESWGRWRDENPEQCKAMEAALVG